MSDFGRQAMHIMDALDGAAAQMEREARLVRASLSRGGFTPHELAIMRAVLAQKKAFYTQSHLIGLALEQWLDDTAPVTTTLVGVYAGIAALRDAEGDLTRVAAVVEKIERALEIVVKLAARLRVALP